MMDRSSEKLLPDVVSPLRSLGGSGVDNLVAQALAVQAALDQVLVALWSASPNGRDYQGDPSRLRLAERQYAERVNVVNALLDSMTEEIGMLYQL